MELYLAQTGMYINLVNTFTWNCLPNNKIIFFIELETKRKNKLDATKQIQTWPPFPGVCLSLYWIVFSTSQPWNNVDPTSRMHHRRHSSSHPAPYPPDLSHLPIYHNSLPFLLFHGLFSLLTIRSEFLSFWRNRKMWREYLKLRILHRQIGDSSKLQSLGHSIWWILQPSKTDTNEDEIIEGQKLVKWVEDYRCIWILTWFYKILK